MEQYAVSGALRLRPKRRLGMTLMELLIVLAITAIFAAIALPVFTRVRRASTQSVCMSNIHQISLAAFLYAEDNDSTYPTSPTDPTADPAGGYGYLYAHDDFCQGRDADQISWVSLVTPYVARTRPNVHEHGTGSHSKADKQEIFFCPNDSDRGARPQTSYEFKLWLATNRKLAEVLVPAQMVMFWEQWSFHQDDLLSEYDRRSILNVICVDGHARKLHLTDTTSAHFGAGPDLHGLFMGTDGRWQEYDENDLWP